MNIKDDVIELKEEVKKMQEQNKSLASEILGDLKRENKILKVLLGISIIVNVLIALILV